MLQKMLLPLIIIACAQLTGCASVPMASSQQDEVRKEFSPPTDNTAGLYIFRDSILGGALKKTVLIDGEIIGETATKTYFYRNIEPGEHILSTESEFSDNTLLLKAEAGINYFVRQYIKLGVFVGGANLELVPEEEGKQAVLSCKLAEEVNKITAVAP